MPASIQYPWRQYLPFSVALLLVLFAAPIRAQEVRRARVTPGRVIVGQYVNRSELLFRSARGASAVLEKGAPMPTAGRPGRLAAAPARPARPAGRVARPARPAEPGVAVARVAIGRTPATRWNTTTGRRALGSVVTTGGLPRPRAGDDACIAPDLVKSDASDCCSYRYAEGGTDVWYRQPLHVFGTEAAARTFAATVRANMPMFPPFGNPDVRLSNGWVYNGADENFHGALDYSLGSDATGSGIDPAFEVRSIASGTVVGVLWDDWSGNIVIVEHTAPNGDRYRSAYKHLRNGFDNDLAKARGLAVKEDQKFDADDNPTSRLKYQRFANLDDPTTQHWGTNSQRIAVTVGQHVGAGQRIGWSGNTGPGGAGMGLADDGTPKNPDTANNHLHLMVTVPDPASAGDWVQIDPYGVYNQKSESGCYDLLDTSAYVRLFAPFYPTFHNVPAEYIGFYWGYYTGMDMGLRTISLHRRGDRVLASGSFQRGLPAAWYMRMYMTGDDYQKWATTYYERGFRPREISVTHDAGGEPRFTVIWKKIAGERFLARHGMSDADWRAAWQDQVVNRDRRVDERVVYREGNRRRTAAVFVTSAPSGFYEYHRLTARAYQDTVDALSARGWGLVKAEAEELREGLRFGGIWQRRTGGWAARHDLSPATYQAQVEDLTGKGYRLIDIQGYADSRRFIAVWEKP